MAFKTYRFLLKANKPLLMQINEENFQRARKKAEDIQEMIELNGGEYEEWFSSLIWEDWIGCDKCRIYLHEAECWGYDGCHGFENGCGCTECSRMRREMQGY